MNLIKSQNTPYTLELSLTESAVLLQLANQILRESKKSNILNPTVSICVDSCTCSHLSDLVRNLSTLIDFQLEE